MITMKHKPYHLPQISAPADIVAKKLEEEDIDYDYIEVDPNKLNVSQGFTFSDDVGKAKADDMNPIWIDEEDNVLDGHHRLVRAMLDNVPIKAIKIKMNGKDACRLLNKIEDIYEYEEKQRMEEVLAQDAINAENQINGGIVESEFLSNLEEDNLGIQKETPSKNEQTVVAYRREPIKENSAIGNFFTLKPVSGFHKYEIDFENLLDTHALGLTYKDSQNPIEILSKIWFPHVNFEKLSAQYNMPAVNLKNKAIAEKAQKLGYDGIKYGDTLIQGLK
jgi:hypothetical protein